MKLLWWRRKDKQVSRKKALRELRRAQRFRGKGKRGMSHNDGYSTPDHSSGGGGYF